MKLIIIDDHNQHIELTGAKARRVILDNDIQSMFHVEDDKYLLYKPKGFWRPYCPTCSKLIAQRDARMGGTNAKV